MVINVNLWIHLPVWNTLVMDGFLLLGPSAQVCRSVFSFDQVEMSCIFLTMKFGSEVESFGYFVLFRNDDLVKKDFEYGTSTADL